MFDAVLAKELERAGRFGYVVSLILFDVDRLSTINQEHGYGVGDRILERLGILIRQYFRQHDWVARHSEDSIAVLLTRTDAEHATELAERVRATVEERLGFTDHRTDRPVPVTLSAAVINVQIALGDVIDPERLMADAETAVERAKQQGRNRVERVDGYSGATLRPAQAPAPAPTLPAVLFLVVRLQLRDHGRIGERRRVAERLAFGDVAQQPAHDLARPRLRQIGGEQNVVGPGDRADLLDDVLLELVDELLRTEPLASRLPSA